MAKINESEVTENLASDQSRLLNQSQNVSLSKWLTMVGWIGMIVFAFHASTHMVAAGDTWVALACGRHFVNHGVDTVEPFSANAHKAGPTAEEVKTWPKWAQSLTEKVGLETVKKWHPTGWVNQNWLTHVIFYKLVTTFGSEEKPFYDALVYWKFALYFVTVFCVYAIARVQKVTPLLAAAFAAFSMFIGRSFLDVRPAGFSNLMVPALILCFTLAQYRHVLWIWLIVPLSVVWCNLHGGYIYVFIMLVPFWGINLLCLPFRDKIDSLDLKGLIHTACAGVVALIAVILFNPFHLTNLTHTFVISVSEHAERWRAIYEWHPAFEWDNPVGTAVPFLFLFIMVWLVIVIWPMVTLWSHYTLKDPVQDRKLKGREKRRQARMMKQMTGQTDEPDAFVMPKLNPALLAVALLTIYMAYRSRRFIPIAGMSACPFVALMIQDIYQCIRGTLYFQEHNKLKCPEMQKPLQQGFLALAGVIVLWFGSWAGAKYHRIYLSPWPADSHYHSQFMRMTASFVKPFEVCEFIRDNHLKGKMMNYWTEGGAIAFGQTPDPNTGVTPLQLFMDGRAQAAYDRKSFDLWNDLWNAEKYGQMILRKKAQKQRVTADDYKAAGKWITEQLRHYKVWVALVPQGQFDNNFCRALDYLPNEWALVYQDGKQKLFVDIKTVQGQELINGIRSGRTVFPNEFTKNLNLSYFSLVYDRTEGAKKRALEYAVKACELNPCQASIQQLWIVAQYTPSLAAEIVDYCLNYIQDFETNKGKYKKQHGYQERVGAARIACSIVQRYAKGKVDVQTQSKLAKLSSQYLSQLTETHTVMRW